MSTPAQPPRARAALVNTGDGTFYVDVIHGDDIICSTYERDTEAEAWADAKRAALAILRDCPVKSVADQPAPFPARMPASAIHDDDTPAPPPAADEEEEANPNEVMELGA